MWGSPAHPGMTLLGIGGVLPQAALPAKDSDSWPRFMIALYRNVVRQKELCVLMCMCVFVCKR